MRAKPGTGVVGDRGSPCFRGGTNTAEWTTGVEPDPTESGSVAEEKSGMKGGVSGPVAIEDRVTGEKPPVAGA